MTPRDPTSRWRLAFTGVTGATVVVGLFGWLTMIVAGRYLGASDFAHFSVLWGLFFGLGGCLAGLQQEVTRSCTSGRILNRGQGPNALSCAFAIGFTFAGFAGVSSLAWGQAIDEYSPELAAPLAIGLCGLTVFTTTNGLLATNRKWRFLSWQLMNDQIIRFLAVGGLIWAGAAGEPLIWGLVVSAFIGLYPLLRHDGRNLRTIAIGSSKGGFTGRTLVAMGASASAGLLVAGFPMLVAVAATGRLPSEAGAIFAAIQLTRSPIMLPIFGLRPVFLTWLMDHQSKVGALMGRVVALTFALGAVVAGFAWIVLPPSVRAIYGDGFDVSGAVAASVSCGAVLLGTLTLTGLALIALDRDASSASGWGVALLTTIAILALPLDLPTRIALSTVLGPGMGFLHNLFRIRSVQAEGKRRL